MPSHTTIPFASNEIGFVLDKLFTRRPRPKQRSADMKDWFDFDRDLEGLKTIFLGNPLNVLWPSPKNNLASDGVCLESVLRLRVSHSKAACLGIPHGPNLWFIVPQTAWSHSGFLR